MAVRTGTQLKADLVLVTDALTTAVGDPTAVNIAAVVTAANTLETNSIDSGATPVQRTSGGPVTSDFAGVAREVRRQVKSLQRNGHGAGVPAADTTKALKGIQKFTTDVRQPWLGTHRLTTST